MITIVYDGLGIFAMTNTILPCLLIQVYDRNKIMVNEI